MNHCLGISVTTNLTRPTSVGLGVGTTTVLDYPTDPGLGFLVSTLNNNRIVKHSFGVTLETIHQVDIPPPALGNDTAGDNWNWGILKDIIINGDVTLAIPDRPFPPWNYHSPNVVLGYQNNPRWVHPGTITHKPCGYWYMTELLEGTALSMSARIIATACQNDKPYIYGIGVDKRVYRYNMISGKFTGVADLPYDFDFVAGVSDNFCTAVIDEYTYESEFPSDKYMYVVFAKNNLCKYYKFDLEQGLLVGETSLSMSGLTGIHGGHSHGHYSIFKGTTTSAQGPTLVFNNATCEYLPECSGVMVDNTPDFSMYGWVFYVVGAGATESTFEPYILYHDYPVLMTQAITGPWGNPQRTWDGGYGGPSEWWGWCEYVGAFHFGFAGYHPSGPVMNWNLSGSMPYVKPFNGGQEALGMHYSKWGFGSGMRWALGFDWVVGVPNRMERLGYVDGLLESKQTIQLWDCGYGGCGWFQWSDAEQRQILHIGRNSILSYYCDTPITLNTVSTGKSIIDPVWPVDDIKYPEVNKWMPRIKWSR